METEMMERLITIRGKVVSFGPEVINAIYRLLDHDIEAFMVKDYWSGARLASKLCPRKNVPWVIIKAWIL
ncbi:hypothetical protein H5410_046297 [Solanum commersonii]|uniref:Uncharacterized protein n=1 Tax=Solanum commersonii TaxID=4109 RepID=A0A9J5XE23_SOLCO|nr:hypothetical protein H5410_046297 [Solanum commersonii]